MAAVYWKAKIKDRTGRKKLKGAQSHHRGSGGARERQRRGGGGAGPAREPGDVLKWGPLKIGRWVTPLWYLRRPSQLRKPAVARLILQAPPIQSGGKWRERGRGTFNLAICRRRFLLALTGKPSSHFLPRVASCLMCQKLCRVTRLGGQMFAFGTNHKGVSIPAVISISQHFHTCITSICGAFECPVLWRNGAEKIQWLLVGTLRGNFWTNALSGWTFYVVFGTNWGKIVMLTV